MRIHPATSYIGLKANVSRVQVGKEFTIEGVLVDWQGKPVSTGDDVQLSFFRVETEYRWAYDNVRGHWRTFFDERLVRETSQASKFANGRLSARFTPSAHARAFVVRAQSGARQTELQIDGGYWWYGGHGEGDRTPRPDAPANVAMTLPKVVNVGDKVSAEVEIPFSGRALFTLEGDRLMASEWREVKAGKQTYTFTVDQVVPNAYVSVFVVKDPHLESKSAFLPERAFSVQGFRVNSKERALDVKITSVDEIEPRKTLQVDVQVTPGEKASVVVAAVDEGILSLTRYQTPEPVSLLHPKRALGVGTFETVGWDVLLPSGTSPSTGGDEEAGAGGRVSPVKPVALWSGMLETDASGKVSVKLEVPQYRGKLRVMAFAATPGRVGAAEKGVIVKEPLVLQTTLPRFLMRGDKAQVPVSLTNLSGKAREASVRVVVLPLETPGLSESDEAKASTKVRIAGKSSHAMNLDVGETEQVAFGLEGLAPVGAVKVRIEATSGEIHVYEELDVPLSVDAPRSRKTKRIELKPGANDLKPLLDGWLPTSEVSNIVVSSSPFFDVFGHLRYLARYPYGCIEQTSSSTLPLLFLNKVAADVMPDAMNESVDKMAHAGVDRILSMQTPVGGFSYWPGGSDPAFWSTAYATHVLMLAQKAKLDAPQKRIDAAVAYLENEVANRLESAPGNVWTSEGEAYAHYVLALAGKGRKARIEKLLAELGKPDWQSWYGKAEARFLLNAALFAAGDRRAEAALRQVPTDAVGTRRSNDWSFYSDGRARGLMLVVLIEQLGASDALVSTVADRVASYLRDHQSYWYSTQELAWGITGIGMMMKPGASPKGAKLVVDGKARTPLSETPQLAALRPKDKDPAQLSWFVPRASERGSVQLDHTGTGTLWAIVNSDGIAIGDPRVTGGDGLILEREYLNSEGQNISRAQLGDLITVVVKVSNKLGRRVQNLAVVDRLPAGFEIENARLSAKRRGARGAPPDASGDGEDGSGNSCGESCGESCGGGGGGTVAEQNAFAVEHMNIRDDRIEAFGTLQQSGDGELRYEVRAVTAGTFAAPGTEAEAMYDSAIWARQPSKSIVVDGPWGEFFQ
jgi:uncharacterized protein YfaS (alpha-2-macroglobulin family)